MSMQIFYFSGTGNSLAAAKDIADGTGAELIPIASLKNETTVAPNADTVGIIFPVYYAYLPVIVKEFAQKLICSPNQYVFAVCTHGGAAMGSLRQLKRILEKKGIRFSAAYGIHMPQNAFLKPREDKEKLLSVWHLKRDLIVSNTNRKVNGLFYNNVALELTIIPVLFLIKSACRKSFAVQTNLPADTPMDILIRNMDSGFFTNDACTGCGVCTTVCPVDNISIINEKPQWQHHCENCLACVNWCPSMAIRGGISTGFFYRHPLIKLSDIRQQRT